jgi:hypothetical protein
MNRLILLTSTTLLTSLLSADVGANSTNIQSLVEQIKTAKPENRRELTNRLKIELRSQNIQTRQKAMQDLRRSFANKGNHQANGKRRGLGKGKNREFFQKNGENLQHSTQKQMCKGEGNREGKGKGKHKNQEHKNTNKQHQNKEHQQNMRAK